MTEMHFESRMSDSDALMWRIEKDPLLRSTITVVSVLDQRPHRGRLMDKIDRGSRVIPRMRQRVVGNPLSIAPRSNSLHADRNCRSDSSAGSRSAVIA